MMANWYNTDISGSIQDRLIKIYILSFVSNTSFFHDPAWCAL